MAASDQRARNKYWCLCIKFFIGCEKCGIKPVDEKDCQNFHFHHENPDIKLIKISRLVSGGAAARILIAELEKTIVVCEDCHLKIHGLTRMW